MLSHNSGLTVLLVEDSPMDAEFTEIILERAGLGGGLRVAESVALAVEAVSAEVPDVILLDLGLPDAADFEGVHLLARQAPATPIVVLTGQGHDDLAIEALESGAQDYVVKDQLTPEVLGRAIRYSIERKRSERELTLAARFDALTGLVNRSSFLGQVDHALARAARNGTTVDLLFIDLDRFKNVNDSLGHAAGDELLRQVATRLKACVRVSDIVARLGGDEFTVLLEESESPSAASVVGKKILSALGEPFEIAGVEVVVTPSIGVAGFPAAGKDTAALLQHADTAMYSAKARGRNMLEFFTPDMNLAVREAFETEMALRRAVANDGFELYFQPILTRETESVSGVEALIRWRPEDGGDVRPPADFLPALEKAGLMPQVGDWALREACRQLSEWQETLHPELRMAVNVSPSQLRMPGFASRVAEILEEFSLRAADLSIEITEEVLLSNTRENLATLEALRRLGVSVAIDDFGSGYSSLSYLTDFPFDTVKVDRAFTEKLEERGEKALVMAGILSIAASLGRRVVAEGVESQAQLDFLSEQSCDEVQGFLFSRPLAPVTLESRWTVGGRWRRPDGSETPSGDRVEPMTPHRLGATGS